MKKRKLGKSNLEVSALGFGCMGMSFGPEWLNNKDEIDYGTTQKGEPFENPEAMVSRKSVADLLVKLATTPNFEIGSSLGDHKTL